MEKIYGDLNNPAALASVDKLYREAKVNNQDITKEDVKQFLQAQDSYTLMRVTNKKFRRRKFLFKHTGHTLLGDVAYFHFYKKSNKNVGYLLFLIDGFSRYLTILPLTSLRSTHVAPVFRNFLENNIFTYRKFFTDSGVEFRSKAMCKVYSDFNLQWYTTHSKEIKCSIAEILIKNIKIKLAKYIVHYNTETYLPVLNQIVETYNHSPHTSLQGNKPIDIHLQHDRTKQRELVKSIYARHSNKTKPFTNNLSLGQVVRLRTYKKTFTKSFYVQNTRELFKVTKVNNEHVPITYEVSDLENNQIKGIFYRQELIEAKDSGKYEIKILKERTRKKVREYLVSYIFYPDSKPQWIKQNALAAMS